MPNKAKSISNRRARFDYELGDTLIVGLELTGAETKSLRMGHGNLRGAYVTINNNSELILINATIASSSGIHIAEADQTRPRKLLAKKREIKNLIEAKHQGKTIIPLEMLTTGRYIKLKIAIARGKKRYDKRQTLKAKDQNRQINRELKRR
ncbi:MAG: SsrA-binding protein SmpB [Candidatus Saccharimonadales bacterium]